MLKKVGSHTICNCTYLAAFLFIPFLPRHNAPTLRLPRSRVSRVPQTCDIAYCLSVATRPTYKPSTGSILQLAGRGTLVTYSVITVPC